VTGSFDKIVHQGR